MIYRILHRKQKIEQHEPHKKGVSLGAQERWTVPVPPVAPVGITLVTNLMIHHVIVLCPSHTMTQISITLALSSLYIVRLTTCYLLMCYSTNIGHMNTWIHIAFCKFLHSQNTTAMCFEYVVPITKLNSPL
jgi:hypothetical protein